MFRTALNGYWSAPPYPYGDVANAITVPLPKPYRRARFDGSLDPASKTVTQRGYEGAVLLDDAASLGTTDQ